MSNILFFISSIVILALFYTVYIAKMLKQRQKGIRTNQIAIGKKAKGVMIVEALLGATSYGIIVMQLVSILLSLSYLPADVRFTGVLLGLIGDIIFGISVYTMRDSWRAGIPEKDETKMVIEGIYGYSRNPAFLGFYFMYLGILLMYFNWYLLIVTVLTIIVFHLQILQEEKYLETKHGEEYRTYKKTVFRYLGRTKG